MACDPNVLIEQAKCIETCIPAGMLPAVNASLLCQIADNGGIINSAQQVIGAGTDYTLTAAVADVVFGTTSPSLVLPTAGTYLVMASTSYQADALGAADTAQIRLRNTTDGITIGNNGPVFNAGLASNFQEAMAMGIVTITGAKTVTLQALNNTAARGLILAVRTTLLAIRLF